MDPKCHETGLVNSDLQGQESWGSINVHRPVFQFPTCSPFQSLKSARTQLLSGHLGGSIPHTSVKDVRINVGESGFESITQHWLT